MRLFDGVRNAFGKVGDFVTDNPLASIGYVAGGPASFVSGAIGDRLLGNEGGVIGNLTERETKDINPYTGAAYGQAQNEYALRNQQLQRQLGGLGRAPTSAQDATTQFGAQAAAANAFNNPASGMYGPYAGYVGSGANYAQPGVQAGYNAAAGLTDDAGLQAFMANSPAMQQVAFGQYSPMTQMLNAQAADQARRSIQNTGQQFANQGAFNSGASAAAMAEAGARPFADVQNQLGMAQAQLGSQLQQQLLGQTAQSAQQRAQLGVRAGETDVQRMLANRDAANQMGQFNTRMGYQSALDQAKLAAQLQQNAFNAAQSYGAPQFQTQPSILDEIGQVVGPIAQFGSMFV